LFICWEIVVWASMFIIPLGKSRRAAVVYYVISTIGSFAMLFGGYFLYNFLPTGTIGNLISGGMIPIIYILIGLKVGAELSGIITNFLSEEVQS